MNEKNGNEKRKDLYESVEEGKRHYSLMASQMELAKSLLDPEDFEAYIKTEEEMKRNKDLK